MCGIAGIFNLDGAQCSEPVLQNMSDAIAHRGPDGQGSFVHENVGLAHRRLAILDLTEMGQQPMTSKNGKWVIVFNGCIYNYRELREELKLKGHEFVSGTDTEVIAEGLAAYGTKIIERFNGMFAIAAWNTEEKALYLSRDRFGVKPLYFWFNGKTIVFASEIKSIIRHPEYSMAVNPHALNEYFTFQNLFSFQTLFQGVELLPAANTTKITHTTKEVQHNAWWDYNFSEPDETMGFEDAKAETSRLLKQAVSRQMRADVDVGSYLSGGIDSGAITGMASGHVERLMTFTCGFDMNQVTGYEANFDERRAAELMSNYFNTEHYEQVMNAGDLRWALPRVVHHIEDLRVGMSYPNYYISRLASKFVKVCLQGTGGDELFGGYPWRYYRVFKSLNQQAFFDQYYDFWQRLVPDNKRLELFTDSIASKMDFAAPRSVFERVFLFNKNLRYDTPEEHIQNSLYFEIKTFLPGLLLVGDRLSMASGLEERYPFLDNDLVDFAQRIPVRHKLADLHKFKKLNENMFGYKKNAYREFSDGKNVLRGSLNEFLPAEIINRKKQGFSAPDESWYRGKNAQYIKELLLDKNAVSTEFISRKYMTDVVEEHMNGKVNHRLLIWSFMNFEWWCRIFLKGEKVE